MLLNRLNLSVAALASKDASRVNLSTVHITPEHTEATDGHCAGRVTMPHDAVADFPDCAGVVGTSDPLTPCLIPADAAVALSKAIPRKTPIPVLQNARVDIVASNANGTFRAVTTDMDRTTPVEVRKIDLDYPTIDQVLPTAEPAFSIGFNAELLAKVLKVAAQFNDRSHAVRLDFFPDEKGNLDVSPVRITATNVYTGQTGTFLVMPMRLVTA